VNECLRIRRGGEGRSLYWEPLLRRREGLAYMDMVIDDAHRLAAERLLDQQAEAARSLPRVPIHRSA
jgi:hypothetical protein